MRASAGTRPPSVSLTTSPATMSAAGRIFQSPSRRTEAVIANPRFQRGERRLRAALLNIAQHGVEDEEQADHRASTIFAEDEFQHDRALEHPGHGRPEFFQRPRKRMRADVGDRVGADRVKPPIRLGTGQPDRRACVRG